ncbi:uncharacterized protein LOC117895126 [Drosophila subobscura]|uniref:uncharacterized protein LOC117895126 n=1 Tax=Drosophila subobscura TaxID=7241 RepID=UPI00155A0B59|nr:uncharacterized protein LOC117895126 [Drosophila subobscura]
MPKDIFRKRFAHRRDQLHRDLDELEEQLRRVASDGQPEVQAEVQAEPQAEEQPKPPAKPKEIIGKVIRPQRHAPNVRYHYGSGEPSTNWLCSDDIPIVTRRALEDNGSEQLMARHQMDDVGSEFSHTVWKVVKPGQRRDKKYDKNGVRIGYIQELPVETGDEKGIGMGIGVGKGKGKENVPPAVGKSAQVAELVLPFGCTANECKLKFADRAALSAHQRLSGHHDWQHQCEKCKQFFRQINYLNRHKAACLKEGKDGAEPE